MGKKTRHDCAQPERGLRVKNPVWLFIDWEINFAHQARWVGAQEDFDLWIHARRFLHLARHDAALCVDPPGKQRQAAGLRASYGLHYGKRASRF